MTRNDEVPQEVGEAIDSLLAAERTLVRAEEKVGPYYAGARLLHDEMLAQETARDALETVIRDYITTLRAKLEAAEGEVARLRELLGVARGNISEWGGPYQTDDARSEILDALPALLALAEAVMASPVVPVTEMTELPNKPPTHWDEPCFKTTYVRMLRCEADGRLVAAPDGE